MGVGSGQADGDVVLMMLFVNPIKLRMMEQPMGPVEAHVHHEEKKHKLEEYLSRSRPILQSVLILKFVCKRSSQDNKGQDQKIIEKDCPDCFLQKIFPIAVVLLPWPRVLTKKALTLWTRNRYKKGCLAL